MPTLSTIHFRLLFSGFLIFITYKFLAPAEHSGIEIPYLDKILHAGVFFVLAFLSDKALSIKRRYHYLWLGIFGLLIEILQAQTGYRSAELMDWIADMIGVVMCFSTLDVWQKLQAKRQ